MNSKLRSRSTLLVPLTTERSKNLSDPHRVGPGAEFFLVYSRPHLTTQRTSLEISRARRWKGWDWMGREGNGVSYRSWIGSESR